MRVLVIAPHMDDEAIGVGATIAKHVNSGDEVEVCFVSQRAYGHRYLKKYLARDLKEAARAMEILGYKKAIFLGLKDEKVEGAFCRLLSKLELLVLPFQPKVVYIPFIHDLNQDHRAVSRAARIVLRPFVFKQIRALYYYEVPGTTELSIERPFQATLYNDVEGTITKKFEAIGCYRDGFRNGNHPRSRALICNLSTRRGAEAGLKRAEAFEVVFMKRRGDEI